MSFSYVEVIVCSAHAHVSDMYTVYIQTNTHTYIHTYSVHKEENEDVVQRVLTSCNGRFKLAHCLPKWPHRGLESMGEIGRLTVRASLQQGCTNGFYVARFERARPGDKQSCVSATQNTNKTVGHDQQIGAKSGQSAVHGKPLKAGGEKTKGGASIGGKGAGEANVNTKRKAEDRQTPAGRDKKVKLAGETAGEAQAVHVPLTAIDVD